MSFYTDQPYLINNATGQVIKNPYYQGDPNVYSSSRTQATQPTVGQQAAGTAGNVAGLATGVGTANYLTGTGAAQTGGSLTTSLPSVMSEAEMIESAPTIFGENALSGTTSTAGSQGGLGLAGAAPYAGAAIGTYLVGKGMYDLAKGKKDNSATGTASRLQTAITTGGLSEMGRALGLGGKSTKDYQRERWGKVGDQSPGWADVYNRISEYRKNNPNEGTWTEKEDPTGKYVGQKWSYNAMEDIAKTTDNYLGYDAVLGNAEAFGDNWHLINDAQKKELMKRLVNEGQYYSNKGDVLLRDKNLARQYYDQISGLNKYSDLAKAL